MLVEEVPADSSADKIGFREGDRLISHDGTPLLSAAAVQAAEENTFGKDAVVWLLQRDDATLTLRTLPGKLGIRVRPVLAPPVLSLYEDGRTAREARNTDEVVVKWMAAARAALDGGDALAAAWLYGRVGEIREGQRQWKDASDAYAAAWGLLKQSTDRSAQSRTLFALARCSQSSNEFPAAHRWAEEAERIDTAAGNEMWAAGDLNALGLIARSRGDLVSAEAYHRRGLSIHERLASHSLDAATSLNNLGAVGHLRGELAAAHGYYTDALAIRGRLAPDSLDVSRSLNNLGMVAYDRGDLAEAEDYLRHALAIKERVVPESLETATTLNNLGIVARRRNDLLVSEDYQRRALAIRERVAPDSMAFALSLHNLGVIACFSRFRST